MILPRGQRQRGDVASNPPLLGELPNRPVLRERLEMDQTLSVHVFDEDTDRGKVQQHRRIVVNVDGQSLAHEYPIRGLALVINE